MPAEFDPAAELGLFPDKLFVCNCRGFLTKNNNIRDLCSRFISNGDHVYDVIDRYDDLTAYVLGREEATAGSTLKWVVPFLKAYGATDHSMHQYSRECLEMMPSAGKTMRYVSELMPTFITTSTYEHGILPIMEELDAPLCEVFCSKLELDPANFGRADSRKIREMAQELASMKIPKVKYKLNVPMEVHENDVRIIKHIDLLLQSRLAELPAMNLMESTSPVTSHKKAYQLLDIRRQTGIDLDGVFYIGGDATDYQSMDLVQDSGGLSVAFNGAEFAVRGSTIAVMSKDSTVGAVLAGEFYNRGIQAVLDLANNWERKYLKEADVFDRYLLDEMLALHPRKLPEVRLVDRHNIDSLAEESDKYRRKLLGL